MSLEEHPQNFSVIYREFREFQEAALKTLNEFHHVCKNNGINYQLTYGSLLGIIRDGGQIPWDYDIDVFVSYEEKDALIDALKKGLDKNYFFYCPEVSSECRHVIMRVAPKGYRTEALHVDVFYYTGVPEDPSEREQHIEEIGRLAEARFRKLVKPREEAAGEKKKWLKLWLQKLPYLFKSTDKIQTQYDELCRKYKPSESEYCVSADSFSDWYLIPTRLFRNTKIIETSIGEFNIPSEYEEMLSIMYGDYGKIPPLENRINELIRSHSRLKFFEALSKPR